MKVVIRVDASATIGTGHVMRCLTLASTLKEQNSTVFFVCREHEGHLCDLIEERGFSVSRLPAPNFTHDVEEKSSHAAWLGSFWQEDAEQVRRAIETWGLKPDWLVVDHYALGRRWENDMRASTTHVMVIDDLADREHDCDLLLDQNFVAQMQTRYVHKVPTQCFLLLGPQYALLQSIYAELHDRVSPREGKIQRIFIFFGGADRANLTGRSLAALLSLNRPDIKVDVVISSNSRHAKAVREQVLGHSHIHLHSGLPTLAPLMAKADISIGAGGATSWERLCLKLSTIVVTQAENQLAVAEELGKRGLIIWIGSTSDVSEATIADTLTPLLSVGAKPWLPKYNNLVDGHGSRRVCEAMLHYSLSLRKN